MHADGKCWSCWMNILLSDGCLLCYTKFENKTLHNKLKIKRLSICRYQRKERKRIKKGEKSKKVKIAQRLCQALAQLRWPVAGALGSKQIPLFWVLLSVRSTHMPPAHEGCPRVLLVPSFGEHFAADPRFQGTRPHSACRYGTNKR